MLEKNNDRLIEMSSTISDIIYALEAYAVDHPDAIVIIPGCEFSAQSFKTVKVKKRMDRNGNQKYTDFIAVDDDYNAIVLDMGASYFPATGIYKTMNTNNNKTVSQEIEEFIELLDNDNQLPDALIDYFGDHYMFEGSNGVLYTPSPCIYYFDPAHYCTTEDTLMDTFPQLRQTTGWKSFMFYNPINGVCVSKYSFDKAFQQFGDPILIKAIEKMSRPDPPAYTPASIEDMLRKSYPALCEKYGPDITLEQDHPTTWGHVLDEIAPEEIAPEEIWSATPIDDSPLEMIEIIKTLTETKQTETNSARSLIDRLRAQKKVPRDIPVRKDN